MASKEYREQQLDKNKWCGKIDKPTLIFWSINPGETKSLVIVDTFVIKNGTRFLQNSKEGYLLSIDDLIIELPTKEELPEVIYKD